MSHARRIASTEDAVREREVIDLRPELPVARRDVRLVVPGPVGRCGVDHFQEPFFCFWIVTGTKEPQAELPFVTLTWPDTRLFCWKPNETVRATGPVVTVKIATLVAVPPGVVREIVPVVAAVGTVAVTEVAVLVGERRRHAVEPDRRHAREVGAGDGHARPDLSARRRERRDRRNTRDA